jgi:hypothetical protein
MENKTSENVRRFNHVKNKGCAETPIKLCVVNLVTIFPLFQFLK